MKRYTVNFGSKNITVCMDEKTSMQVDDMEITAAEYDGGNHNFNGLRGAVIDKAVTKLFGKNCFWFGQYD
jgi:hypothetical protein